MIAKFGDSPSTRLRSTFADLPHYTNLSIELKSPNLSGIIPGERDFSRQRRIISRHRMNVRLLMALYPPPLCHHEQRNTEGNRYFISWMKSVRSWTKESIKVLEFEIHFFWYSICDNPRNYGIKPMNESKFVSRIRILLLIASKLSAIKLGSLENNRSIRDLSESTWINKESQLGP